VQWFVIDPGRSTVIIEARSSVGPIAWEVTSPVGAFTLAQDGLDPTGAAGHLELELARMSSGNRVYDAELLRRVDAHRFPRARLELSSATTAEDGLIQAVGTVEFHGVRRPLNGTLRLERAGGGLLVTGQHVVDIRDFELPPPTMLMLKIYPDVHVHLIVSARPDA